MKYIILLKALAEQKEEKDSKPPKKKVEIGHVIIIPDTDKKVYVTAIGKEGVTAQDEEGNKYLVRHENIKTEEDLSEEEKDNTNEIENEQKEEIKDSLEDKLNKKEHKKGTKFDTKKPHKEDISKEEEVTVESYLKKNMKQNDWVTTAVLAKLTGISISKVSRELEELEEKGLVQVQAESKTGEVLYKYVKNERIKEEARANNYPRDQFDREKHKKENDEEIKKPNLKKLKPSEVWKKED
jgi:predicted transcriptional regulator